MKIQLRKPRKTEDVPTGYVEGLHILDEYVTSPPSNQNLVNVFKDQWTSALPDASNLISGGSFPAFADDRIEWMIRKTGGVEGKKFLELGPLEGGHAWMLEQAGAETIVSVESNQRAFMKCLLVQQMFEMNRTKFLLGDFVEYLKSSPTKVDTVLACGVLYHMLNPAEVIELASKISNRIFIWTQYYDKELIAANPPIARTFPGTFKTVNQNGYSHKLYVHEYLEQMSVTTFCGGSNPTSNWMDKEGLLGCLKHFGYDVQTIQYDKPDHFTGPAISLMAEKS